MDSLITAAAQALAMGDPLGALNKVALRDDAPALALRGIAMAQLGDLDRAKALVRRATKAFGPKEAVARARCVVAEAEIALASRDLAWPAKALAAASVTLEAHGDRTNAAHARYLEARRLLLIGRLDEAERKLAQLDLSALTPALRAIHELTVTGHMGVNVGFTNFSPHRAISSPSPLLAIGCFCAVLRWPPHTGTRLSKWWSRIRLNR
jgi:ATP/maltotriose-dependent transcriptional regulator MalT